MPKLKELIEEGLYGKGLVLINTPELVNRYKACCSEMGIPVTALREFNIDALGWSPEIATELKDDFYLCQEIANPFAIVVTPEQANAAIYYPHHSYDWRLMSLWYETNRVPLFEITKQAAIWLEIDQGVHLYRNPKDLLRVNNATVRAHVMGGLSDVATEQRELAGRFLEPTGHLDTELVEQIRNSFTIAGDLRTHALEIFDLHFPSIRDFYSRVFGGSFVLRSRSTEENRGQDDIVIVRDPEHADPGNNVFVADMNLLPILVEKGYVNNDIEGWNTRLPSLKLIAQSYLMDVLDEQEPDVDFVSLNDSRKKALITKYADELDVYFEIRSLFSSLEDGRAIESVPEAISHLIIHPSDDLEQADREVVEQLLTYICGGRLITLFYRHQKAAFVEAYRHQWNTPKRGWARARIAEFYEASSKSGNNRPRTK